MPRWIYSSPPTSCPRSEQDTAAQLDKLGPEFSIRWGFHYTDSHRMLREGDFIVQGPDGHILIIEAKAGPCELDPATGRWSTADGENPFTQLDSQRSGILSQVREFARFHCADRLPYIDAVLGLPDIEIAPEQLHHYAHPRVKIAASNDLADFPAWWTHRFAKRNLRCTFEQARQVFNALFAAGAPESATTHLLDHAAQILERHTMQRFELLDALEENHQLLVRGGPGTGKTQLALEQARRWARKGSSVLFLCYNLELEATLRPVCARLSCDITIRSYESLASELLGETIDATRLSKEEKSTFFDRTLPEKLRVLVAATGFQPRFDALVVDEAQDHNTASPPDPGWWEIYFKLLRRGLDAPMAIFHDPSQRLSLRDGVFDEAALRGTLPHPVSVRLRHPVRYTRQLRRFLAGLEVPATSDLLADFHGTQILPEGPEPETISLSDPAEEGPACARIVKRWINSGLAKPHEIAVLFPSQNTPPAWLDSELEGIRFQQTRAHRLETTATAALPPSAVLPPSAPSPFDTRGPTTRPLVACYSIHRAKGLERRAILLTGLPAWEECAKNDFRARTFVLGATRAQQLLAILQ